MDAEPIMDLLGFVLGSSFVLILGLLAVLALIWCLVPFAIFGIKPRLDSMVRAVGEQTRVQQELVRELRALRDRIGERPPPAGQAEPKQGENS